MKKKEIKNLLEIELMRLGDSLNHFIDKTELWSEPILQEIEWMEQDEDDKKTKENWIKKLPECEILCVKSMYLRIAAFALIKGLLDVEFARLISRDLTVLLIQDDLKSGAKVPEEMINSMLDYMNDKQSRNKKKK